MRVTVSGSEVEKWTGSDEASKERIARRDLGYWMVITGGAGDGNEALSNGRSS
jgi:hypothetical protein